MKCPCINCIVFACCNGRVKEEGITKMVVAGLAAECGILREFLTCDSIFNISFDDPKLDDIRHAFGWRSPSEIWVDAKWIMEGQR